MERTADGDTETAAEEDAAILEHAASICCVVAAAMQREEARDNDRGRARAANMAREGCTSNCDSTSERVSERVYRIAMTSLRCDIDSLIQFTIHSSPAVRAIAPGVSVLRLHALPLLHAGIAVSCRAC